MLTYCVFNYFVTPIPLLVSQWWGAYSTQNYLDVFAPKPKIDSIVQPVYQYNWNAGGAWGFMLIDFG